MSRGKRILHVDIPAITAALLGGSKLSAVAADHGISEAWLYHHVSAAGIAHTWTTAEERQLLAELRAGRALVVRTGCAPAAARLAQRVGEALAEFRSSSGAVSGS